MDAMSLVQNFGKLDMFLTMTCNPNWPEIKGLLQYNDDAQNMPDLIARVFHAKMQELKNDIAKKKIFGEIAAYTYVIEFQKRGLPHAHFLIILKDNCHAISPSFVDNFVSTEIPDKHLQPVLYELVKQHMVHGPCGFLNPNCPCMTQRKCKSAPTCKSKYPKLFSDATEFADDSYPIYKRRNTPFLVHVKGFNLDNRWIVPYNPQLLLKFDCHINVEVCASIKSVKYIYKYIYKGHARRPEAAWRIFGFAIAEMKPTVIQLQIHLENSQYINFYGHERITYIVSREESSRTMLTEFFAMNLSSDFARTLNLLYVEFPCHFVWCKSNKSWKPRKQLTVIGRLVVVNPTEGERTGLHTNAEAESLVLKMIANIVQEMGKKTKDFCLFDLLESYDFPERVINEILHEKNLPVSEADLLAIHKLNACQRAAFKTITDVVLGNKPSAFFVDGPGGTGKTFLYRCLLAFVRSKGLIALATATSGIAASILPGGRTTHSRFKLPLDGTDKYVCNIGKHTANASLLRHSKLILWDEASMTHRNIVESLDMTLKDIMDCQDLFGGKVIVFGGDFSQTLPVVRHGKKEDFIAASLVKSTSIWPHICRLTLVENMCAHADPTFASYLMKIGIMAIVIYKLPRQIVVTKNGEQNVHDFVVMNEEYKS
nr:ATP-dependent DNA helicase PIF1 [Ipomoea batatas]